MKIIYIANSDNIHTQRWVKPLVDLGHDVFVVSYKPINYIWDNSVSFIDLTKNTNLPVIKWVIWGLIIFFYVRKIKPDVINALQIPGAGWLGTMAFYKPFIVSGWGSDVLIEPRKSWLRNILVKIVLAKSSYISVPSQLMCTALLNLGVQRKKIHIINWGIETNIFSSHPMDKHITRDELGVPYEDIVVFCPRAIQSIYNIDLTINAFHECVNYYPNLRLVLLSYNPDKSYLESIHDLIEKLGIRERVCFLPAQNSLEAMARLYRMSDIIISIPTSEGYGFTVYEAIACGCPVVISDLPVYQELESSKNVIKAIVNNLDSTISAMLLLLGDDVLRTSLVNNNLSLIENYSIQTRVQLVLDLYKKR